MTTSKGTFLSRFNKACYVAGAAVALTCVASLPHPTSSAETVAALVTPWLLPRRRYGAGVALAVNALTVATAFAGATAYAHLEMRQAAAARAPAASP